MIWSRINVVIGTTTISIHNGWKPLKNSHKIYIEMRHFRWLFKTLCHFFLNELSKGKNNKWREKRYRSTTLSPSTSVKPVMMAASTLCWLHYTILYQGKRESKKLFAQSTLACFQKMHSALSLLFKFLWVVKQCFFFCAKCSPPFHFLYWCKKISIANLVVWKLG